MPTIKRILSYLGRYPALSLAQLSCATLSTAMLLVFPQMAKNIIEDVIQPGNPDRLILYFCIMLGAFFLRDLLNCLRIFFNNYFEQRAIFDLRSDLYNKLQRLPLRWYDDRRTGDIMTRVAEDVPAMHRLVVDGIEYGLVASLQILGVAAYLFYISPSMALAAISPLPLLILGAVLYTRNARDRYREVRSCTSEMNAILNDNVSGITQIKSYAAENDEHSRFNQASSKVRLATLRVMRAWALYSPSMSFLNSIGYSLVILVAARLALGDLGPDQTIGPLTAFLAIIWALYEPISRLHQLNQMTQSSRAAGERVFAILDAEDEIHSSDGRPLPAKIRGHITFNHVNFAYSEGDLTLRDLNIEAKPGETIALVGPTGAGKSTIVNLLTRFYDYDSGSIQIDDIELNTLNKPELRQQIGFVTQDAFLFNGTIRENLAFAKRDATDEEMWTALQAANAAPFVEAYPAGLNTEVGERGIKLSGGEKQRLSIARALLKDSPILLLDEATASVDPHTEKLIQQALDNLMTNRTSFVIAHRLSTIRNADRIYVLDHGQIVESGTHQQLTELNGLYAKLSKQSFMSTDTPSYA